MSLRRWNMPLVAGVGLCLGLLLLLLLPALVDLPHPQMALMTAWVDGKIVRAPFAPGQMNYLLGSDVLGRDLLSRLVYGARYTLLIAGAINLVKALVGIPLGLAAGWSGGWLRQVSLLMARGMGALPKVVMAVMILAPLRLLMVADATWLVTYGLVMAVLGLPAVVEFTRLRTEELKVMPHVEAARALGASDGQIIWRHIARLLRGDLAVMLAAEMAWVLLMMGQLAVLGIVLGGTSVMVGPLDQALSVEYWPEWSLMLAVNRWAILGRRWHLLLPGLALGLAAFAFHMLAEGLRLRWMRR